MRKKILVVLLLLLFTTKSFGLSDNFEEIIKVKGIKKYNCQGYEINEYIFFAYNKIVYGTPEDAIKEPLQSWKKTNKGRYKRNGILGEYRILGYDFSGKVVKNIEVFYNKSVNVSSNNNYVQIDDAIYTWNDVTKFKFNDVKLYMQNAQFDDFGNTSNSIGLDKIRLEKVSTLTNNGLIYANKVDDLR